MNTELQKELTACIESAILECLEENPGIEKKISWFTILADEDGSVIRGEE